MSFKDEILSSYKHGTLTGLITTITRGNRKESEATLFREAAIALHNNGDIDLLKIPTGLRNERTKDYDFWLVQDFYTQVIPELDAEVEPMMAAVRALVSAAGADLSGGQPSSAFRDWATIEDRSEQVLASIDKSSLDDAQLVMLALQALERTRPDTALDRAIDYLAEPGEAAQLGAAVAIGSFELIADRSTAFKALESLQAAVDATSDDKLSAVIAASAVDVVLRVGAAVEAEALNILATAANNAGDETIYRLSESLWLNAKTLPSGITTILIEVVAAVREGQTGTFRNLDFAISALVESGRIEEAVSLLERLLAAHPSLGDFSELEGSANALLQIDRDKLGEVVVGWLLSEESSIREAVHALMQQQLGDPITFHIDLAPRTFSGPEAVFLARKTIGYLFLRPITAASILLSLLRSAPSEASNEIGEYLFDPLLLNFPGELKVWLSEQVSENLCGGATPYVESALKKLESYFDGLDAIGRVSELRPSERERMIEHHRQNRDMSDVIKKAHEMSVFASLATRSVMLYGKRSISYSKGSDGKRTRHEMELGEISHSVDWPRLQTLEPFTLDYLLRMFRSERIKP